MSKYVSKSVWHMAVNVGQCDKNDVNRIISKIRFLATITLRDRIRREDNKNRF